MSCKEDISLKNQFSFSSSPIYNGGEGIYGKFAYFGSSKGGKFPWWPEEDDEEEEEKAMQPNAKKKDYKQHCFNHYYISRVEEIAKHRQEMLDMVEDLQEFDYELSLKDIVELPAKVEKEVSGEREVWMDNCGKEKEEQEEKKKKKKRRNKKRKHKRGEFLLKMFLPLNLGGKKSLGAPGYSSKVSPRPVGIGSVDKVVVDDEEYERRKMKGCYSFLQNKSKTSSAVEGKY